MPNDIYKVFATWDNSYLDEGRWKINSGIKKVEQDKDYYYFTGYSGSCYKCHKKGYGISTSYGLNLLNKIKEKVNIKVMENVDDWSKII